MGEVRTGMVEKGRRVEEVEREGARPDQRSTRDNGGRQRLQSVYRPAQSSGRVQNLLVYLLKVKCARSESG